MTEDKDARRQHAAQNQSTFRVVNEQLQNLASAFEFVTQKAVFVCECRNLACIEQVEMTMAQYEAMRKDPNRFVVLPGHEVAEVEDVVLRAEGFLLVSKLGVGEEIVRERDPRASRSYGRTPAG